MDKTFVEDERPCDSCVNVTRYGCVSWNCEYINRDKAIKAWREKHEMADRKTEPSNSENPNNCEHITEDGVTCAKYPACDDCLMAISVGININETTNDRKSMSSFVTSLIGNIIWATLLWWGGFWK